MRTRQISGGRSFLSGKQSHSIVVLYCILDRCRYQWEQRPARSPVYSRRVKRPGKRQVIGGSTACPGVKKKARTGKVNAKSAKTKRQFDEMKVHFAKMKDQDGEMKVRFAKTEHQNGKMMLHFVEMKDQDGKMKDQNAKMEHQTVEMYFKGAPAPMNILIFKSE